jgi:CubicO group peptidase (beta-lactamase class C family)
MKLLCFLLAVIASAAQARDTRIAQIDRVFKEWGPATPGCAVGVAEAGKPALIRAYGMADLEHDIPIGADTIFEAGSVSKQFTAAAVALLARDGKLSLDDQVRTFIPELPDYGAPLTIRHMLNHTSGLRDWGSVAALSGWPRGSRAFTQATMLDIVTRQRALNFTPGTRWSYSNSGYNLAVVIVERVAGMSFSQFTRERIFVPLGMRDSSWRDDHTRIVKRRALAYGRETDGFHTMMPFENVIGNGGMLTTIGDLLKWQQNFSTPRVGDARMLLDAATPGVFSDGRAHGYGLGLATGSYRGVHEVQHGGATAGYRAYLSRYPAQQVSIALLCNAAEVNADKVNKQLADIVLAAHLQAKPVPVSRHTLDEAGMARLEGLYRDEQGSTMRVTRQGSELLVNGRPLFAASVARLETGDGGALDFGADGALRRSDRYGSVVAYQRVPAWTSPDAAQLRAFEGVYDSAEAEASLTVVLDKGELTLRATPGVVMRLKPEFQDAFQINGDMLVFRRDAQGKVIGLNTVGGRVWEMRFVRR